MYSWINPQGETVQTKTIQEFADRYGFSLKMAQVLARGYRSRLRGWCSTSKKATKERKRFMTTLVNIKTGEKGVLGMGVKAFARAHGLCFNELSKLVNRHKFIYRYWVLENTHKILQARAGNTYLAENFL